MGRALHEGGTSILTPDFIFGSIHETDGQTFASLALQGGAGEILRAFKDAFDESEFRALGTGGEGHPIRTRNTQEVKPMTLVEEVKEVQLNRGLFAAIEGEEDHDFAQPDKKEEDLPYVVDFRDAALLYSLGFEVRDLRMAGFSVAAMLTAGYPLFELRSGGFRTRGLRDAGMSDIVIRLLGLEGELEHDFLIEFYQHLGGSEWKSKNDFGVLFRAVGEGDTDMDVASMGLGGVDWNDEGRLVGIAIGNNNLLG